MMTPAQYINRTVGKPWVNRSEGPDSYDCWGLVLDSFRCIDGIELNQVPGYEDKGCPTEKAAMIGLSSGDFSPSQPMDGAIMVAYRGDMPIHVGRCIAGGVLHALGKDGTGAVQWHPYRTINRLFQRVEYYAADRAASGPAKSTQTQVT